MRLAVETNPVTCKTEASTTLLQTIPSPLKIKSKILYRSFLALCDEMRVGNHGSQSQS
jgi:hypothetical protein